MDFFIPDIVVANPIPDETIIYYSRKKALINSAATLIFIAIGFAVLKNGSYLFGAPICVIALFYLCIEIIRVFKASPQLILSRNGVWSAKAGFTIWKDISGEHISGNFTGKGARPVLNYISPAGKVIIKVEPLNIRPQDLNVLLKFYRDPW